MAKMKKKKKKKRNILLDVLSPNSNSIFFIFVNF